ncbi:MAG: hypothetical protein ACI4F7_03385, partial [Acutalibacteraceae bacterium]
NGEQIRYTYSKGPFPFSRRNSRGLCELEDLRDAGVRIISIGDSIDYPTYDDWTAIQFRFLINEMPVTDTSKKVKSVIKRRQEDPLHIILTNEDLFCKAMLKLGERMGLQK